MNDPPKAPGVCDACGSGLVQREDDHESVVAQRLRRVRRAHLPADRVLPHPRRACPPVDGNRPMDVVFQDLLQAVEVRA